MFEQLDQAMDIGVGPNIRSFQGQGEEFCHLQLKAAKTFNCPFQFALRKWTPMYVINFGHFENCKIYILEGALGPKYITDVTLNMED